MKTHWKKLINPDYLGAYSLAPKDTKKDEEIVYNDLTVTIEKVVREMIIGTGGKKEECTVAYLTGQKPWILNSTNQKTIEKIHNTPFIEDWAGKKITLYVAYITAFGEHNVPCLRVRPVKPQLPQLTQDHKRWEAIKEAIKTGNVTIEQIKSNYRLSTEIETLLTK
jgi:hypothetical protein